MWTVDANQLGHATWTSDALSLTMDARGGDHGIHVDDPSGRQWFRLDAIEGKELSGVAEQYIRGDELHWWLPQGENEFGVKLTFQPIQSADCQSFILQATVSIQTTLLDSHPKLDIIAPADKTQTSPLPESGSPAVSIASHQGNTVAVLLGKHDSPFTTNHTAGDQVALRLFGDFLEKGVIRKARAWFVFEEANDTVLNKLVTELSESPLPLAP